ncbi:MAG TPA: hypothetical protein PKX40_06575, partial [Spirochaetota bacterium]|nr:hypothetical protein [Spirochaetota bacterium]
MKYYIVQCTFVAPSPAWGATFAENNILAVIDVSIHAPAWGATLCILFLALNVPFQSTRPHGLKRN